MRPVFASAIASVFLIACGNSAATDPAEAAEAGAEAVDQPAAGETGTSEPETAATQVFAAETELFGYYMPDESIGVGSVYLNHISIGMDWEFEQFFSGAEDSYQPLRLDFEDESSPEHIGELGNTYYEVGYALFPDRFNITDTTLTFSGTHDVIGAYSFEGSFNPEQVEAFHQGWPAEGALTGTMRIGDTVFENVSFQGWMGD